MIPPEIVKLRAEIVGVTAELETVRSALPPAVVTEAAVRARVKAAAARFAGQLQCGGLPDTLEEALARDPVGAWCLLMSDKMIALAADGVRREAKGKPTLTAADRTAEIDRLAAKKLALEVREEAAIRRAERDGTEIDRRVDASPHAVLARLKETA